MSEKDKGKTAVTAAKKTDAKKYPVFNYTVSEGSTIILDLRQFLNDNDVSQHNLKSHSFVSCTQTSGIPIGSLEENHQTISFKAPYVRDNDVYTRLEFELRTATNDTNDITTHRVNVIVKRVQRAIVFQGGVALGAYEAGVFDALVKKISEQDEDEGRTGFGKEKRPVFDLVAGTSIGGMNAAIVVSNILKGRSWQDSAQKVVKFWKDQEYPWPTVSEWLDTNPMYRLWWDIAHNTSKVFKHSATQLMELYSNMNAYFKEWYNDDALANWSLVDPNFLKDYVIDGWYIPATAEAARRYYSAKQIETFGAPDVASGIRPWSVLGKFFDLTDPDRLENSLPRADNKHYIVFSLKKTLERFADFPIRTKEGQPRFLLVTVDVETGDAVTFDSYSEIAKYHDDRSTIHNKNGIEIEHALATGTFPDFFDYPKFRVDNAEKGITNEEHIFWDGGFRSNTPVREVIQAHRDYWHKTRKKHRKEERDKKQGGISEEEQEECDNDVPDLEIYIADLWPSELKEGPISFDRDFVEDRKWDLLLGDKTDYDEQIANVVTDYVDLARRLKNLAERSGASEDEINYILNKHASSKNTIGRTRIYKELLEGRFRLAKVVRIDHKDDGNDVSKKIFDYSYKTIENLMERGYQDALVQMDMQRIKDGIAELVIRNSHSSSDGIEKGKQNRHIQKLEEDIHQIQENIKIENGKDTTLNDLATSFLNDVESIQDRSNESGLILKEGKALLIAAAKHFQGTINSTTKR